MDEMINDINQCLNTLRKYNEISGMNHIVDGLEKIITNKKQCIYCGKTFISLKQSIKYCDKCRKNNIPEKLKNRGNDSRQLRGKIYKRLISRENNVEYCPDIYDAFSFSEKAIEYRKNNPDKYYEWLKEIDRITK